MSVKNVDGRVCGSSASKLTLEGRVELQPPSHAWSVSQNLLSRCFLGLSRAMSMFPMRGYNIYIYNYIYISVMYQLNKESACFHSPSVVYFLGAHMCPSNPNAHG